MSINADLMTRIKRLLGRTEGNGCTRAEAAAALAKARDLMQRHSLDFEHVMAFEATEYVDSVVDERPKFSLKIPHEYQQLGIILGNHFEVELTYESLPEPAVTRLIAFGSPLAVETACWVYRFLYGVFEDLWTRYRVETKAPKRKRRAYFEGLLVAVDRSLTLSRPKPPPAESNALAVIGTARRKAFDERFAASFNGPPRAYRQSNDATVGRAGYLAGKDINIARPVAEQRARALPKPGA